MKTVFNKIMLTAVPFAVANSVAAYANSATVDNVAQNFADISSAMLDDSLTTAKSLQNSIQKFLKSPTQANLDEAKALYRLARAPYQQAEIMRFDAENGHVSADLDADGGPASMDDWEGQLNAWPLDEALIDYVDANQYEGATFDGKNIINGLSELTIGPDKFNVEKITPELLISLNEVGGSEANVATGIHAIEFLLCGQDLNGTQAGAGERPVSDYYTDGSQPCTSGATVHDDSNICQRRASYLEVVTQLYVDDLNVMVNEWSSTAQKTPGTLGYDFLNNGSALARIIDSVGDMAAGELASERMKVAVLFGSTEDEHDCFSDNTDIAIYNNAVGIINAYRGSYTRIDGSKMSGPSVSDLIKSQDASLDQSLNAKLDDVETKMKAIVDLSQDEKNPVKFDQIVGGTAEQKAMVLDSSEALIAFADELGNNINEILAIDTQTFDKGTCPSGNVEDCATE